MDLTVDEPGEHTWACGMNMLHGTLIGAPVDHQADRAATGGPAPGDGGAEVVEAVGGVSDSNRGTARAVGVGPRLETGAGRERAEFMLPGALSSPPTDTTRVEAQLGAIGGVDDAQVNLGMEHASCPTTRRWST